MANKYGLITGDLPQGVFASPEEAMLEGEATGGDWSVPVINSETVRYMPLELLARLLGVPDDEPDPPGGAAAVATRNEAA